MVSLILRESTWLAILGLGLGLALALAVARLAGGFLYRVGAADPLIFTVIPLLLLATVLLACIVPARRAANLNPMAALRYD